MTTLNPRQVYDEDSSPSFPPTTDLETEDAKIVQNLFSVLNSTRTDNMIRSRYYYGDTPLRDLGYALPPRVRDRAGASVGWAQKAVDMLAERSVLDGFAWADGVDRLAETLRDNDFYNTYQQAVISELTHCCSFFTVTKGDEKHGDPPVLISAYSAINAAALWDVRRKRIKAGLALVDVDSDGVPSAWNVYTDDATIGFERDGDSWRHEKVAHSMGRPLMEPMPYLPPLDRPFGRPRINHNVRKLCDKAQVTNALISMYSELFTVPPRYLFGAKEQVFPDGVQYDALMGTLLEITDAGDGSKPEYGQLSQVSVQPLVEVYQLWAKEFSAETNIPLNNLGVVQDNPSSAEAMFAAQEPLVIKADRMNARNGKSLANVARMALAVEQGKPLSELTAEERDVTVIWGDTAHVSDAARADATAKEAATLAQYESNGQAVPDVILERMGWDEGQRMRYRVQHDRGQALSNYITSEQRRRAASDLAGFLGQ